MSLIAVLVGSLIAGDVARLGSDEYGIREAAERRLLFFDLLARPYLDRAATESPDPEIRQRSGYLLRQRLSVAGWVLRLYDVLTGDVPAHYWDARTRRFAVELVKYLKVDDCWPGGHPDEWAEDAPWRLNPAHDHYTRWRYNVPLSIGDKCNAAMRRVRTDLALRPRPCP